MIKEGVCLVCLPARGTSQVTGKKCTVTGYGYMGESKYIVSVKEYIYNTILYVPLDILTCVIKLRKK